MSVQIVILAGGTGARLWPLSRSEYPKQFIKLNNNLSLFQQTILRHQNFHNILIIVRHQNRFIALQQVRKLHLPSYIKINIITEPEPKNTGPASIVACLYATMNRLTKVLLVPCDHFIEDDDQYVNMIECLNRQENFDIITLGSPIKTPNTQYGYIKTNRINFNQNIEKNGIYLFKITDFIEKPSEINAICYQKSAQYLWNMGIFLCNVNFVLEQWQKLNPLLLNKIKFCFNNRANNSLFSNLSYTYTHIQPTSFDYAIMENITNCAVYAARADFEWSDLGSFQNLFKFYEDHYNYKIDRVLKPWGYYQVLNDAGNFKVKKLVLHCNGKISLQYHKCRSEHWVIIDGTAKVILDDEEFILRSNDTISIPKLTEHCVENIGNTDLILIEIQIGEVTIESDIVRLIDPYDR